LKNRNTIIAEVEKYYSDKIAAYGASAKGVDWNSEETQNLRFQQLLKVIGNQNFSLLDYGCGYGALLKFMQDTYTGLDYTGFDISKEMLAAGEALYSNKNNIHWINELGSEIYDYSVASGIFNVRMEHDTISWEHYIEETLQELNCISKNGFSFNMLTKYSDKPYMKEYLYYADPCFYFDFCKNKFSKNVALLHDYDLYEFTLIVKK
jgi:SAM-dependent methyltransferase